ncbi:DNA binding methylated-DNA--cysteine S-methyltransferase, partial [Caulochytrium protostelioides]
FSESVYHVLQQIPRGRATTYGHIAALAGFPRHARQVGVWLRDGAAASTAASWRMPWHRVVAAGGRIAPRAPHAQMALQASRLDAEGVAV